jgi:HAD superfamily hydrolase (TIGR01509 family)
MVVVTAMALSAVVFDFDGLILETEEPLYLAWKELWAEHDLDLRLDEWARCVGTRVAIDTFDPVAELIRRTDGRMAVEESTLDHRASIRAAELLEDADLLPGVLEWLAEAEAAGWAIAIASSSPRRWIVRHLERLGHLERFPVISSYDDVGVHKPEPHVYVEACARLGIAPRDAIAVEDSRNGVLAARAAGLRCVAVPTRMTAHLDFSEADLVIESLATIRLMEVVARLEQLR